jgi:uncharacterized protein (UPF0332 family)
MTDKQTLLYYRLRQAEETLEDAQKMLAALVSPRSIINRSYYAVFYSVLALFLQYDINPKTSKHSGVIAILDKDLVHAGKLETRFSKIVHRLFEARQVYDYKELVEVSFEDAKKCLALAAEFVAEIKAIIKAN